MSVQDDFVLLGFVALDLRDQKLDPGVQLVELVGLGAALQAIAYGTRHIIEAMNTKGYYISQIYMCGGHLKNEVFIQEHADVTGCEIIIPREPEAVLLGAAILAAVAAGEYKDVISAMRAMSGVDRVYRPNASTADFHAQKYAVYKEMFKFQNRIHKRMQSVS